MFRRIVCVESIKQLNGIFKDIINTRINDSSKVYDFNDESILSKIKSRTPNGKNFSKELEARVWGGKMI